MPVAPAEHYRAEQARQRVQGLKTGVPLRRYVEGMARRKEILPGSEDLVIAAVVNYRTPGPLRNHLADLGAPPPERPAPLPSGNSHADVIARCAAYLEGEGSKYLNPAHKPDPDELPLVAVARRFGMNKETAEQFYVENAVKLAGRTGASLAAGVFHALSTAEDGRYLGVEERPVNPQPVATAPPAPAFRPGDNGGILINGQFIANPPTPEQAAAAEPVTAMSRYMATVKGAF